MRPFIHAPASSFGAARIARTRPTNECAQCGEAIFMPEWSEWLNPGCARHLWQCEACGYSFETTVRFAAA
jgi:ribosomal protein S27AE